MNINYGEQSRFFQRFASGVTEELQSSHKAVLDSIEHIEQLIGKIESTSSRVLGILNTDKTIVIEAVATILSKIEEYEESLPVYYFDMRTIFCYIHLYTVETSNLKEKLKKIQDQESEKMHTTKMKLSATDEFLRLALSEEIEVTSKNIKNYSSFIENMTSFIKEAEIQDLVDAKIRLFSLKDKIVQFLIDAPVIKSDAFHKVFYFFHKENISEKYHQYSTGRFSAWMNILATTGLCCLMYYMNFLQKEPYL